MDPLNVPYSNKNKKKKSAPDNTMLGLILGLLFPFIGIILLYFFWGTGDFGKYIQSFFNIDSPTAMRNASKILSLSMFAMLLPFNYFLNKKAYYSTRGIIIATGVYALVIILYQFVF